MTNEELIETVRFWQGEFEKMSKRAAKSRKERSGSWLMSVEIAEKVGSLYERNLRLAQDRGISLENFFDYKEERL